MGEQLVDPGKHISLHDGKVAKYASDINLFGGTDFTRELCSGQTHIFQGNTCTYHCNTGFIVVYAHTQYVTACSVCVHLLTILHNESVELFGWMRR